MKQICPPAQCSGCEACANACRHDAISMKPDWRGFLYPAVDASRCVDCGVCEQICPSNQEVEPFVFGKASVYVDRDREALYAASSGGAFGAMARYVLSQGGVVYGCSMDEDYNVSFISAETEEELQRMHGSKYVQSRVGMTYRNILSALRAGRKVLFGACPCQVAALKSYLRRDYQELITMDLICHGVPSQPYFKAYVADLLRRKPGITAFRFRYKPETGSISRQNPIENNDIYVGFYNRDFYMTPFLWGKGYRSSCYRCHYNGGKRPGDFTIGDFWNNHQAHFPIDDTDGASLILFNTSKAKSLEHVFRQNSDYADCSTLDLAMGSKDHGQLEHPSKNDFRTDLAYVLFRLFGVAGPKALFALQCWLMNIKR